MKIKYKFADGTVSEVEVSEEIGAVIVDSRRLEENYDRKCRYHNYSMDAIDYEGVEYADPDTPESLLMGEEDDTELAQQCATLREAMQFLTDVQRRRLLMVADGLSYREIAKREGAASANAIKKSIDAAFKKIRNFW